MKVETVKYTKANGDKSTRHIVVVSKPRPYYLVYDVSKLSLKELDVLELALTQTEEFRDSAMKDFELLTGVSQASLWRSFNPEGIEWEQEDETRMD